MGAWPGAEFILVRKLQRSAEGPAEHVDTLPRLGLVLDSAGKTADPVFDFCICYDQIHVVGNADRAIRSKLRAGNIPRITFTE